MEKIGADLRTGRKLKYLFTKAGLDTEVGIDMDTGYIFIKDDKKRLKLFVDNRWIMEKGMREHGWTEDQIEQYFNNQINLIKKGLKFQFSSCFYAIGKK
jgi:hypothetical protein